MVRVGSCIFCVVVVAAAVVVSVFFGWYFSKWIVSTLVQMFMYFPYIYMDIKGKEKRRHSKRNSLNALSLCLPRTHKIRNANRASVRVEWVWKRCRNKTKRECTIMHAILCMDLFISRRFGVLHTHSRSLTHNNSKQAKQKYNNTKEKERKNCSYKPNVYGKRWNGRWLWCVFRGMGEGDEKQRVSKRRVSYKRKHTQRNSYNKKVEKKRQRRRTYSQRNKYTQQSETTKYFRFVYKPFLSFPFFLFK